MEIGSAGSIPRDQIALRAYFIAERRQREGLPGDESADWIEAERQLCAETGRSPNGAGKRPSRKRGS